MTDRHLTPNERAWRRFKSHKPAMVSLGFVIFVVALIVAWPWIAPYASDATSDQQFSPPGASHWFGTDVHGRDLLSRVFYGARISLLVGLVGTAVALIIGVIWGAAAGYIGGRTDALMMRFVDVLYSLPSVIFVIVLITTLDDWARKLIGSTFGSRVAAITPMIFLFAGLGAVSWLNMARIVRGQVLSLKHRSFIEASRALGAGNIRILFRHIIPNIHGIIITYLTLTIPAIILYESFLSYLGLGVQPPMASWGTLIADGAEQLNPIRVYWWLLVFPASVLVMTLLALNFVGDGLRDAFDPKASERS